MEKIKNLIKENKIIVATCAVFVIAIAVITVSFLGSNKSNANVAKDNTEVQVSKNEAKPSKETAKKGTKEKSTEKSTEKATEASTEKSTEKKTEKNTEKTEQIEESKTPASQGAETQSSSSQASNTGVSSSGSNAQSDKQQSQEQPSSQQQSQEQSSPQQPSPQQPSNQGEQPKPQQPQERYPSGQKTIIFEDYTIGTKVPSEVEAQVKADLKDSIMKRASGSIDNITFDNEISAILEKYGISVQSQGSSGCNSPRSEVMTVEECNELEKAPKRSREQVDIALYTCYYTLGEKDGSNYIVYYVNIFIA